MGRGLNGGSHAGRGNAGQLSRSGNTVIPGFSGGQTPIWQRSRKLGRQPVPRNLLDVPLDRLQWLIRMGRLDASRPITMLELFRAHGHIGAEGIRITEGNAPRFFDHRVCILGSEFTPSAIKRIEDLGGKPIAVYHDAAGLRQLVRPERYAPALLRPYMPPSDYKLACQYSSFEERGYLNQHVRAWMRKHLPELTARYVLIDPVERIEPPRIPLYGEL